MSRIVSTNNTGAYPYDRRDFWHITYKGFAIWIPKNDAYKTVYIAFKNKNWMHCYDLQHAKDLIDTRFVIAA